MSEKNKVLYRRFIDKIINGKNLDVIDELMASDVVDYNPPPDMPPGVEEMKALMNMFFVRLPRPPLDHRPAGRRGGPRRGTSHHHGHAQGRLYGNSSHWKVSQFHRDPHCARRQWQHRGALGEPGRYWNDAATWGYPD